MVRSVYRYAAWCQLAIVVLLATGCAPTQPFFLNESPQLRHYLDKATQIEYPDVDVESLPGTRQNLRPLSLTNHNFEYRDMSLEECVSIALHNAKIFPTTAGSAEFRQNVASQLIGSSVEQVSTIYDVAIGQSTTQSTPLLIDGNGNRTLPRGVLRATQIGGVQDALAEFDAIASAFIDTSNSDRPQNVGPNNNFNPPQFQARNTTQQVAISKRLATGGVATLRQQVIYSRNNVPLTATSRNLSSDWQAIVEAQIQHPLARNRGTLVNRIPIVLASLNEDTAILRYEESVRNLVRDVEVAYWNLYTEYRNVATQLTARNSAQATAYISRKRFEGGAVPVTETAQAEEQYFQFKGQLQTALAGSNLLGQTQDGVFGAESILRELMGIESTDGYLIRPTDEPTIARVEFDWDESVCEMLYRALELRRTKYDIKKAELELISARNQLMPDVNLSVIYRWFGGGDHLGPSDRPDARFPETGSSALADLTSGDYQEAAIRLDIQPNSFAMTRELTRVRGAQLRLTRLTAWMQDQERLMVSRLTNAIRKLQTHYSLMGTNSNRWAKADQTVKVRLKEFELGQANIDVVLDSQRRLALAQIDYYRSVAEYNKSLSYVHYLKGTLLDNNNIFLEEGPWAKKAYWDALERARERSAGKYFEYGVSRPGVVRTGPVEQGAATAAVGDMTLDPFGDDVFATPLDVNDQPIQELPTPAELLTPDPSNAEVIPVPSQPTPTPGTAPATGQGEVPLSRMAKPAGPTSVVAASPTNRSPRPTAQLLRRAPRVVGSGVRQADHQN